MWCFIAINCSNTLAILSSCSSTNLVCSSTTLSKAFFILCLDVPDEDTFALTSSTSSLS
ncbi:hypothetical protein V6Z12_D06G105600 [Gossypium hirsutum]